MPDPDALERPLTDVGLIARSAAGNREAFDEIVRRHQVRVFRLARALTADLGDAEDVLQQTFLSAWQAAPRFRGDASVSTWLLTIARNAAYQLRGQRSRLRLDDTPLEDLGMRAGWGAPNPEALAVRAQQREMLDAAFARLAPDDRQVLTLRDIEGLSGEDTAEVMGVALAAMKSRLHRARLRLAAELRQEEPRARQGT